MLPSLRTYLTGAVSPELFDSLVEAHAVFESYSLPDYEDQFDEALMTSDSIALGDTPDIIVQQTHQCLDFILEEHGIRTIDHTPLQIKTEILQAIQSVVNFEDRGAVLAVADLDLLPEERFAELLAVLTGFDAEHYLTYLDFVTQLLFNRIREIVEEPLVSDIPDDEQAEVYERRNRLARWIQFCQATPHEALDLIRNDLVLGLPYKSYLDLIGRRFEQFTVQEAVLDLMTFALCSSDYHTLPTQGAKEYLELYITDLQQIIALNQALGQLVTGFAKYEKG